jgi:hypothetical protein
MLGKISEKNAAPIETALGFYVQARDAVRLMLLVLTGFCFLIGLVWAFLPHSIGCEPA